MWEGGRKERKKRKIFKTTWEALTAPCSRSTRPFIHAGAARARAHRARARRGRARSRPRASQPGSGPARPPVRWVRSLGGGGGEAAAAGRRRRHRAGRARGVRSCGPETHSRREGGPTADAREESTRAPPRGRREGARSSGPPDPPVLAAAGMSHITIPPGLTELLQGYTVEVLRRRPPDLVEFAIEYFSRMREARGPAMAAAPAPAPGPPAALPSVSQELQELGSGDAEAESDSDEEEEMDGRRRAGSGGGGLRGRAGGRGSGRARRDSPRRRERPAGASDSASEGRARRGPRRRGGGRTPV